MEGGKRMRRIKNSPSHESKRSKRSQKSKIDHKTRAIKLSGIFESPPASRRRALSKWTSRDGRRGQRRGRNCGRSWGAAPPPASRKSTRDPRRRFPSTDFPAKSWPRLPSRPPPRRNPRQNPKSGFGRGNTNHRRPNGPARKYRAREATGRIEDSGGGGR